MRKLLACLVCVAVVLCDVGNSYGMLFAGMAKKRSISNQDKADMYRELAEDDGKLLNNMENAIVWLEGQEEEEKGNYAKAAELYRKAAELGHCDSQYSLGTLYEKGVMLNWSEALKWYTKAADQGHAQAASRAGRLYYHGLGVNQDYLKAAKYYSKAAEAGVSDAQFGIGLMYFAGQGVKQDYNEAYRWLKKAEAQGNTQAPEIRRMVENTIKLKAQIETQRKTALNAKSKKKTSGSNGDFVQAAQDVTEVLGLISDVASVFSGGSSSTNSSQPRRVKSSRTGRTYTASSTPKGNCPNCFGDGRCHVCMRLIPSKDNNCHVCGGSAKCQRCNGTGFI